MRIAVFGAGSLGSALGGLLAAKHEVVLIGRKPQVAAIRRANLVLIGDRKSTVRVEAHDTVEGLAPPDLLVISTKAYDTAEAIRTCKRWIGDETLVLSLQNGLGNLESLREWKGVRAFGGTTTMGATLVSPGLIRISGLGKTVIGADRDKLGAARISEAFGVCGVPTFVSKDIMGEIWAKAIVSSAINPFTAILRVRNGTLLESKAITKLMAEVCRECEAVSSRAGVALPQRSIYARVRGVAKGTARNKSSMLQDIERRRRTEIDHINAAFSRLGDSYGVSTPVNDTLVAMVRGLESKKTTQKS